MVGDVNQDGKIHANDARLALRFCARLETPDELQKVLADANGDKLVKSADARLILRYAAKLDKAGENGNIIESKVRLVEGADWSYTVVYDFSEVTPTEPTTAA